MHLGLLPRLENVGLLPFVAKHLQYIGFINVLIFCQWLRDMSRLSSSMIFYTNYWMNWTTCSQIMCLQLYMCWWDAITLSPWCSSPTAVFKMIFFSCIPHEYTHLCKVRGVSKMLLFPRPIKALIPFLSLSSSMRHGFEFLMWSWSWVLTDCLHVDSGAYDWINTIFNYLILFLRLQKSALSKW